MALPRCLLILPLAVLLSACSGEPAPDATAAATPASGGHPVTVANARIRALPPGAPATAGYLNLTNTGSEERRITGASSAIAARVELHMHIHRDGMMGMREIPHEHLPPGVTVSFRPGGTHLMFFEPDTLEAGDTVDVTLTFDDGSTQDVAFAVVRPGADG